MTSGGAVGLIWAQAANGVIGRDNAIPWHLPADLAHFRAVTAGATVLMGRRTWESLPARFRPLPGRRNVVLTRDRAWRAAGADIAHDLAAGLAGGGWVIGGAAVYEAALPLAAVCEVTEIGRPYDGDVYAPVLDDAWRLVSTGEWQRGDEDLPFRWLRYTR